VKPDRLYQFEPVVGWLVVDALREEGTPAGDQLAELFALLIPGGEPHGVAQVFSATDYELLESVLATHGLQPEFRHDRCESCHHFHWAGECPAPPPEPIRRARLDLTENATLDQTIVNLIPRLGKRATLHGLAAALADQGHSLRLVRDTVDQLTRARRIRRDARGFYGVGAVHAGTAPELQLRSSDPSYGQATLGGLL